MVLLDEGNTPRTGFERDFRRDSDARKVKIKRINANRLFIRYFLPFQTKGGEQRGAQSAVVVKLVKVKCKGGRQDEAQGHGLSRRLCRRQSHAAEALCFLPSTFLSSFYFPPYQLFYPESQDLRLSHTSRV